MILSQIHDDHLAPEAIAKLLDAADDSGLESLVELEATARLRLSSSDSKNTGAWFGSLAKAILASESSANLSRRVSLAVSAVEWLFKEGDLATAEQLMLRTTDLCRSASVPGALRFSLNVLGAIRCKQLNSTGAIAVLAESAQIAESIGDLTSVCAALGNLASARYDLGLIDESIALNHYIVAMSTNNPLRQTLLSTAHHNLALAFEQLDDLSTASEHMRLCEASAPIPAGPVSSLGTAMRIALAARICIRRGDIERGKLLSTELRQHAERVDTPLATTHLYLTEALVACATGNASSGFETLDKVASVAARDHPVYRDVLHVSNLCCQLSGRNGQAREELYLREHAAWQRTNAIRQIAAIQRSLRATCDLNESMIEALPKEARKKLLTKTVLRREKRTLLGQVESLATLAETREAAGDHSALVGWLSSTLTTRLGSDQKAATVLEMAARLHDIGKLAVPDVVLLKRGKLSPTEMEIMRRHALEGCSMLTDILSTAESVFGKSRSNEDQTLRLAAEIALHHHEWWDGTGYPRGVAGDAIPEAARIVAIADTFDELTQSRPYHEAIGFEAALDQIDALSGKQFDPKLTPLFREIVETILREGGPDLDMLKGLTRKNTSPLAKANQIIERILKSPEAQRARATPLQPASQTQH